MVVAHDPQPVDITRIIGFSVIIPYGQLSERFETAGLSWY